MGHKTRKYKEKMIFFTGGNVYLDHTFLGSCRPTIFILVVVQFFQKEKRKVSSSFKPGFLLHGNVENWRCFIFGTSKIGATPNLASDSDSLPWNRSKNFISAKKLFFSLFCFFIFPFVVVFFLQYHKSYSTVPLVYFELQLISIVSILSIRFQVENFAKLFLFFHF